MPRITSFSGKVLAGKTLKRVLDPVIPFVPNFGSVATSFINSFSGDKKYIDITNGSDSNNGDTDATAYQTLSYAQSQTASIGTAVMYVIKPGVYTLTPVLIPAVTGSHSSVGLSDDGLPRTFFCAAGQVTLQWVSEGRDCPMVSFENTNSTVYGAILKRDNNGKTLSYAIPMFNATTAWSKGDFYNCVFQETNANGNWSLMQDEGASGGANTLGTMETIVNNCSFYTTENAQNDYTTSTGLVLNNSAFSHIWGTNSNSIRNNTISAQTMDATTYELAANNSTHGVHSGTYAWGTDMWVVEEPEEPVAGNYTHPAYGTLVGAFTSDWQPASTPISVTEGNPHPSDSTNVILSDSAFQAVRAATTANRVWYVWGDNLEFYVSFARSAIESANVWPAPTTTINPNTFGFRESTHYRVHWHSETTGSNIAGSDYSFVSYRNTNSVSVYELGPVKAVSKNVTMNTEHATGKFYIFYQ